MTVSKLPESDLQVLNRWRETGVIVEVDQTKLHEAAPNGTCLLFCGDGDQSDDFLRHFVTMMSAGSRIHFHSFNGGALRLHPDVPVPVEMRVDHALLVELVATRQMKGISTLVLSAHHPCGLAGAMNLALPDVLWHLVQSVDWVAEQTGWDRQRLVPIFHVCYEPGMRRTYFVRSKQRDQIYG